MAHLVKRIWRSSWTPVCLLVAALSAILAFRNKENRQTFQLEGDLLVSGNPYLREVCLTIDDGPHTKTITSMLDTLKAENVRATFFVVGKVVERDPSLVRRMMAEGHEVGNHTYTHKRLNQMPLASARQEIAACASTVRRSTGAEMTLLRPPGMGFNNEVLALTQEMGYVTVHWNVVAADYVPVPPATIVKRVVSQTHPGSVILLHDSPDTAKALPEIIRRLKSQGYRFVTATQMLARLPRPVIVASNAFAVAPDPIPQNSKPVALARKKPGKARSVLPPKPVTRTRVKSEGVPDLPVWDGSAPTTKGDHAPDQGFES